MLNTVTLATAVVLALAPDQEPPGQSLAIGASLSGSCPTIPQRPEFSGGAALLKNPSTPWGVQVAGGFSFDRALESFGQLQHEYPTILVGKPFVVCSLDRSLGEVPVFQIRMPAADREQAIELCDRLEAAGGACVVFRSPEEVSASPAGTASPGG